MTLIENEEVTLAYMSGEGYPDPTDIQAEEGEIEKGETESSPIKDTEELDSSPVECIEDTDRAEYERLIRGRFKEHFAADTQRLINRRFKKYKAAEEKLARLEAEAARYADVERLLTEERARAVRETEDRMTRQFRANRTRTEENALSAHSAHPKFDVSRLTKSERAQLATRAQSGEKIHLK